MNRRKFIAATAAAGAALCPVSAAAQDEPAADKNVEGKGPRDNSPGQLSRRTNPIAVSTYSFWRFQDDSQVTIADCIDLAAEWGFDAVELLEVQMDREKEDRESPHANAFLQGLK